MNENKVSTIHSIRFRIRIIILIIAVLLLVAVETTVTRTVERTVEKIMVSRLEGDIHYIEDLIGENTWHADNGTLYCGETPIGNGTEEMAYLDPFLKMEQKTGTFSYTFVRCPDDEPSGEQWQQGHYKRVSGSTLSPNGKKIIGTYMDKEVADELDRTGVFLGPANVVGRMVFCLYHTLKDSAGNDIGVIVVGRDIDEIEALSRSAVLVLFVVVLLLVLAVSIALNILISRWITKLDKANHYLTDISTGVFPEKPLDLHSKDELSVMTQCINEMTSSLKEKERIAGELEAGANIQRYMLPGRFPAFPERDEFDIYAKMVPAREVGGDFYDFFMTDERHLAVLIADVSGKGVPAALFMATAKMLIKNHAQMGMEPCDVFTAVNRLLCEGNESNTFVTAWMGVLDLADGRLKYVNAGHNPPLIGRKDGGFTYLKSRPALVLAAMDGIVYKQNELTMQPGERLFLYTDGVTEAVNDQEELYGTARLNEYLNGNGASPLNEVLSGLLENINRFAGTREQFDDITMLILSYNKEYNDMAGMQERTFDARLECLQDVTGFVEGELEKNRAPLKVMTPVSVVVEELFVNIARYAYPEQNGTMKLGVLCGEDSVTLRFTDSGIPFNPLEKKDPDVTLDANERQIGGLGVYLVKKTMDGFTYERRNEQNIVTVTKNFVK
ncbi:MAG: SpoIIE family protein phosphatase [Clostridia bacterium]|nr:SpoIIE family protein phosphatase [Clostridia bacterium]